MTFKQVHLTKCPSAGVLSASASDRARLRGLVGSMSDSRARGPRFDPRSGHILLFLFPLIQEGQLSVTGKIMCTKYWLTA